MCIRYIHLMLTQFHQKNTSELIAYLKTTCGVMQMRLREYMDAYQDTQSQLSEALEKISHLERQILGTRQGYAKPSSDVIVIDQTQSQSGSVSRYC